VIQTYKKILLAVDGSDNNSYAVKDAICVAKAMGAKITAMYVMAGASLKPNAFGGDVSASERANIAEKSAEEAFSKVQADCAQAGVELETVAVQGNPGAELVKASENYDLLVCGTLGIGGLSKVFVGSVSKEIVKSAKCPVLICRQK